MAAHALGCRKSPGDRLLIGPGRKLVAHQTKLQRRLGRTRVTLLAGVGKRFVDIGVADLHVVAKLFAHDVLPHQLRLDAVLECLDVNAGLGERLSKAVHVEIVLLGHVLEDLAHVILVNRKGELAALLHLQPLVDELVGRFLFQLGGGLLLGGDGEETLALGDVVVRNRVVIHEHDDGYLLCHSKRCGRDHEAGKQQGGDGDQACVPRYNPASAVSFSCCQVKWVMVSRHELARYGTISGLAADPNVSLTDVEYLYAPRYFKLKLTRTRSSGLMSWSSMKER